MYVGEVQRTEAGMGLAIGQDVVISVPEINRELRHWLNGIALIHRVNTEDFNG